MEKKNTSKTISLTVAHPAYGLEWTIAPHAALTKAAVGACKNERIEYAISVMPRRKAVG